MYVELELAIADIFKEEKIKYVFGCSGEHIKVMWDVLQRKKFDLILNKQEGNAVYMADSFAKLSGQVSIVLATAGPGATNMVTGLASAFVDSVPIIVLTGISPTFSHGRNAGQDGSGRGRSPEQRLIFKSCTKAAMTAITPESVPNIIRESFRIAICGRPGPVYIEIPSDYWGKKILYKKIKNQKYKNFNIPNCNEQECLNIYDQLHRAKYPMLIIGEGAIEHGIAKNLKNFLQILNIPFAVSPIAKNIVDEFDFFYLGAMRFINNRCKVYEYMKKSDFLLFLGDRMHEWEMNKYDKSLIENKKLAQVDPDYNEIGRVFPVDYSSVGSVSSFIKNIKVKKHKNYFNIKDRKIKLDHKFQKLALYKDKNGIHPHNLNNIVEKLADNDAIIVCDTGYAKSMSIIKFRTKLSQKFVVADKYGPMGYSIPAAIGAAIKSGKEVVCFVGDGGAQMSLNEFGTAMNYKIKVIFIIENNGGNISMKNKNDNKYSCIHNFINPDYVEIAKGYGFDGYKVNTSKDFESAFKKAKRSKKSVVIDARINQNLMRW